MTTPLHPAAAHNLPIFITAPGDTDVLMVVTAVFLLVAVVTFGLVFFRIHTLPERMAHGSHKLQFEIVAVLGLVALFTHMHGFWIAGLLLALIDIPDFPGWLGRIARAVERIAGMKPDESPVEAPPGNAIASASAENATTVPGQAQSRSAKDEELAHA
jgi:hypothetical protein